MTQEAAAIKTQPSTPESALNKLEVFVGKWDVAGKSYAEGSSNENLQVSSVEMKFVQTGEWLSGGYFLKNHWDGHVGESEFNGMEVIGYDAESETYSSRFFDNVGNAPTYQLSVRDNVWTYIGELQRATFEFSADGDEMTIHWDWKKTDGEDWKPLCDLTATKT